MNRKIIFSLLLPLSLAVTGPVCAAPELTIAPDVYLSGGETLYLQGTARPESEVIIILKNEGGEAKRWTVKAGLDGEWYLISKETVKDGDYILQAEAEEDGEAVYSVGHPISVSSNGIIFVGPFSLSYKSLVFILAVFLGAAFAVFLRSRLRLRKEKLKVKKETVEARDVCGIVFGGLSEKVEKRIAMIDGQPEFSPGEKRAFEDIKEILEASRILIEKEISDVEKLAK